MLLELTQGEIFYRLACRRGHFNISRQWRRRIGYVQSFSAYLMIGTNEPLRSEAFGVSTCTLCAVFPTFHLQWCMLLKPLALTVLSWIQVQTLIAENALYKECTGKSAAELELMSSKAVALEVSPFRTTVLVL